MVSDKIRTLKTTLALASAGNVTLNRGFISLLRRQLSGIHEEVEALEQAQVPRAVQLPRALSAAARLPVMQRPANDPRPGPRAGNDRRRT